MSLAVLGITSVTTIAVQMYRRYPMIRHLDRVGGHYVTRLDQQRGAPLEVGRLGELLGVRPAVSEIICVELSGSQVTNDSLARLRGLTGLESLTASNCQITDAGLEHLEGLSTLKFLHLDRALITDAGLPHLTGLKTLQVLSLRDTDVSDAGLVHLKKLNLIGLVLSGTQVTDYGLNHLIGLTNLDSLMLDGTHVTDAGLLHLTNLSNLRWISVRDTKCTVEGITEFERVMPNVTIMK